MEGPNGNDDSDFAFFGGSPDTADLPFPFGPTPEPGYEPGDSDDDGSDGAHSYDQHEHGVIRYGRFSDEDDERAADDIRDSVPWTRGPIHVIRGAAEQREREAADTGDRHVGRVADARSGEHPAGEHGGRTAGAARVANNLGDATLRLRETPSGGIALVPRRPIDDGPIETDTATIERVIKRQYERSNLTEAPKFRECQFEATLVGLRANPNGDWIIQFKVSPEFDNAVTQLKHGYGLALQADFRRKQRATDDES